ncbi:hypothetical protein MES4922_490067 [Mesorhizobium ventifaucium]|uniref:Exopolysaccharide production repressor exox n=1 Tax=Mesorhizobium ventifaucium TaxID=666020 RepID=A0ABN8K7V2_9HYPH|nr:hypothetical protein MES4922_490067 [Mesorhizobium ventifaucium]
MLGGARRFIFGLMFVVNIGLALCLAYLFIGRGYFVVSGFTSVEVVTIVLVALGVLLTARRGCWRSLSVGSAVDGSKNANVAQLDTSERQRTQTRAKRGQGPL